MEDVFKPEVKEYCSGQEALELLAFGWRPVDDECLLNKPRRRFKKEMNIFRHHYIRIKGIKEKNYVWRMHQAVAKLKRLAEKRLITLFVFENDAEPPFFKTAEIAKYAPEDPEAIEQAETAKTTAGGYTTPYLDIMHKIISKGYVSAEKQPLVKNLTLQIIEEAKAAGVNISETMAQSMATILRLPEMAKGGLRKQKKE